MTDLRKKLEAELKQKFEGWDFSYLSRSGRMQEFPIDWNYQSVIHSCYINASTLLDMGTGGGEFLSSLPDLPKKTFATEGYEPNIPIAKEFLAKRGIEVRAIQNDQIPYGDDFFDAVINRHESFDCKEVMRVLKADGVFVTQQIGGLNNHDLNQIFGVPAFEYHDWSLARACSGLISAGLEIQEKRDCLTKTRFYDIGALVYYLKCIPWQIPDFSVEKYYSKLEFLAEQFDHNGFYDILQHRFLVIAKKGGQKGRLKVDE